MFPAPVPAEVPLSQHFAAREYTVPRGSKVRWRQRKVMLPCEECAWYVYEQMMARCPIRIHVRQARVRRTLPSGQHIDLCNAHAQLWRARDD